MIALLLSMLLYSNCVSGDLILYEDTSYKIIPDSSMLVCDITYTGNGITYTEITLFDQYYQVDTYHYTSGYAMPDSVLINTSYYSYTHQEN